MPAVARLIAASSHTGTPVSRAGSAAWISAVLNAPRTTVEGNSFIAPAGWRVEVRGPATLLTPPEGGSHIAIVDVRAKDADSAVAAAWAAYNPHPKWPHKVTHDIPVKDGWAGIPRYT